jgi:hypothetical protein
MFGYTKIQRWMDVVLMRLGELDSHSSLRQQESHAVLSKKLDDLIAVSDAANKLLEAKVLRLEGAILSLDSKLTELAVKVSDLEADHCDSSLRLMLLVQGGDRNLVRTEELMARVGEVEEHLAQRYRHLEGLLISMN